MFRIYFRVNSDVYLELIAKLSLDGCSFSSASLQRKVSPMVMTEKINGMRMYVQLTKKGKSISYYSCTNILHSTYVRSAFPLNALKPLFTPEVGYTPINHSLGKVHLLWRSSENSHTAHVTTCAWIKALD